MQRVRIGVDTGGTFTDFVIIRRGRVRILKLLSTSARPEAAILQGVAAMDSAPSIVHGSTVATNAFLERKGARTALLTTAGFEDVLEIGRQTRRELYNINVTRPAVVVPENLRFGIAERVLHDGAVHIPIDNEQLVDVVKRLREEHVESIAVCFLFSFANASHETAAGQAVEKLGLPVSLSSEVLPEYREYERTSTTVINAYLAPVMGRYLQRLRDSLPDTPIQVMQSNGGAISADVAAGLPVRTIVSGPAAGVVGAFHVARSSGYSQIITFDMGGTSTDVSLCNGSLRMTHENEIDGMPVGIPMIDIHTVGAGGGSIARVDPGGALKVGPESAGSDPGPIAYGSGEEMTVTDANVIARRLLPRFFLGGAMKLETERVRGIAAGLRWTRGWKSLEAAAQGVIDVVNSNMEHAIRLISIERGHDPRDFVLCSFGGAAGLHAAELARSLGIPRVLIPRFPGALSALGLLLADARRDYSRSLLGEVGSSRVDLQACKLEYSIVSPK